MAESRKHITVRLTPGARRAGITVLDDGVLQIAVTEPPEKGKANHAAIQALANYFHVAPSCIRLLRGARGRIKVFEIYV